MADGQVIRNDIVQISWKVAKSPIDSITGDLNKLQKKVKELNGNRKELKEFQNECKKLNAQRFTSLSKNIDKVTAKIGKGMINAAKKATIAIGAIGTAGAAGAFKLADMASDLSETVNKVEVSFGDSSDEVKKWSKNSIKDMGLAQQTALDMAALFGDMGTGMGIPQKEAANMSMSLTQLGADLASFKNVDIEQVTTALNGVFTGETESLKTLGIVMTQTNLEQFAMSKGIKKSIKDMTEAEKVNLRYAYVMEKTKNAQGDFARTGGGFANQLRMIKEQMKQIGTTIGGVFIGGFEGVLKKVNSFGASLNTKLNEVLEDGFQFGDIAKIAPVFGSAEPVINRVATAIHNAVTKVKEFLANDEKMTIIKGIFSSIKDTVSKLASIIGTLATKVWDFITSTKVLNTVKAVFDGISKAIGWVKDNLGWLKEIAIAVGSAFLIFGAAVKVVSAGFAIYNGVLKVYKTFQLISTAAQMGFNSALLACPISWIVVAIVGLIAVIVLLVRNWDKVKEVAGKCWNKIKETWGKVSNWFKETVVQPVKKYFSGLWDSITDNASEVKNKIVDAFKTAVDDVKNAWGGIKDWFADIWKQTVKNVATPVNKIIDGANWVLEKVGSDKKFGHWEPYARGTNGHPGGNAIVNDGRGAELVQMPNGFTFIPKGKNVGIPNAPKGMKVLNAERTAQLMGKKRPTFHYENGSGWLDDVFSFFDNAGGLAGKVIEKFVSLKNMGGYALDVGKGIVNTAKETMVSWIKNLFSKFGGKGLGDYDPSKGVEQWRSTVANALKMEGLHSEANIKRTLHQMQTESGGNPRAINLWDSNAKKGIPSKGLMQVIDPTFKSYARKGYDKNIYDPMSNILASVRYAMSRYGSLANAYRGVGYADGIGTIKLPVYNPESSVSTSRTSSTHNNSYAPSFTLNMSGTVDRTTERTIKRWVQEALEEMFDSMSRTSPRLTEV